jgi:hypothetical protein
MHGMTSNLSRRMGLNAVEKKAAEGKAPVHEPEPGAEGPGRP